MAVAHRERVVDPPAFAAIADDFTGAIDLAGMVARKGLRSLVAIGIESLEELTAHGAQAITVALKSRSIAAEQAVQSSLAAAAALRRSGAKQIYFKYCSTFDSTSSGNIGPVTEALRAMLGAGAVPFVPAFPENGRRVYRGHLFVGDVLLHESGMESHPLNPMRDANLCRVLAAQSRASTALMPLETVRHGAAAVRSALKCFETDRPLVIVDAIEDSDLEIIAAAVFDRVLVTGGSALGQYVARRRGGDTDATPAPQEFKVRAGRYAVLTGSCSRRTREQIRHFSTQAPTLTFSSQDLAEDDHRLLDRTRSWFEAQSADQPVLIGSDGLPGRDARASCATERLLAQIAELLLKRGVTRLVVAGGETSGAVLTALNARGLQIGPEIAPGVSWSRVIGGPGDGIAVALKSGNFGAEDLFSAAVRRLRLIEDAA